MKVERVCVHACVCMPVCACVCVREERNTNIWGYLEPRKPVPEEEHSCSFQKLLPPRAFPTELGCLSQARFHTAEAEPTPPL